MWFPGISRPENFREHTLLQMWFCLDGWWENGRMVEGCLWQGKREWKETLTHTWNAVGLNYGYYYNVLCWSIPLKIVWGIAYASDVWVANNRWYCSVVIKVLNINCNIRDMHRQMRILETVFIMERGKSLHIIIILWVFMCSTVSIFGIWPNTRDQFKLYVFKSQRISEIFFMFSMFPCPCFLIG
jgi:hypothetical protein